MTETYTPFPDFDSEALRHALGAESRSLRDVAHGEGEAVTLAGKAQLEVYPSAGVARVTTDNARVELFRVPGMTTDDEAGRVVFEHGADNNRSRLLVRADGNVSFYPVRLATGGARTDETTQRAPVDHPAPHTGSQSVTERPETSADRAAESEERPIVTLTGRLGQDPWFARDEDVLVAGFPLAVNHEQGATTWHTVKARGEVADQVDSGHKAGYIRRGKKVDVTGSFAEQTGKAKPPFEATVVTRAQTNQKPSTGQRP